MRDQSDADTPLEQMSLDLLTRLRRQEGTFACASAQMTRLEDALTALTRTTDQRLLMIDAALARLTAGSYGFCTECGSEIALARLEVMPATCLCAACDR